MYHKKKCFICENSYPLTREFFYDSTKAMSKGKPRLWSAYCIKCMIFYGVLYYKKTRLWGRPDFNSQNFQGIFQNKQEILDYLNFDEIECLLCGKRWKNLGKHLGNTHNITSKRYRVLFGIPLSGYSLLGKNTKTFLSKRTKKRAPQLRQQLIDCKKLRIEGVKKRKNTQHVMVSKNLKKKARNRINNTTQYNKKYQKTIETFCNVCNKKIMRSPFGIKLLESQKRQPICGKCAWTQNNLKNKKKCEFIQVKCAFCGKKSKKTKGGLEGLIKKNLKPYCSNKCQQKSWYAKKIKEKIHY